MVISGFLPGGRLVKITEEEVLHISGLARLTLTADEIRKYRKDMNAILDYMEMLNELDTAGVEPTFHTRSITNALREDEVVPSQERGDALLNAPKAQDGSIVVPKVIE
jgi:aspartyl-tRNA(Asn)/glutamyl-tRNA(Gln) amidotransferase subunit C